MLPRTTDRWEIRSEVLPFRFGRFEPELCHACSFAQQRIWMLKALIHSACREVTPNAPITQAPQDLSQGSSLATSSAAPGNSVDLGNLWQVYTVLNRFDEAKKVLDRGLATTSIRSSG